MSATISWSYGGRNVTHVSLSIPRVGVWVAEIEADGEMPAAGTRASLVLCGSTWAGTIIRSGIHAGKPSGLLIGGAGAWGQPVRARGYHSDAQVRAKLVVADLARDAGEALADWTIGEKLLGRDYSRRAGPGSLALSDALRGVPWYVGADGLTYCQERPSGAAAGPVLGWDPARRMVTLGAELDVTSVQPGATVALPTGETVTISEVTWTMAGDAIRAECWCPVTAGPSRLAAAVAAVAERSAPLRIWGKYRYRVFRMAPDGRVELQSAKQVDGLPNIIPADQWCGAPGAHGTLAVGSEVLVEFIAGDPSDPVITAFAPKGANGHVPQSLELCDGELPVARVGDAVTVFLPTTGGLFSGTLGGEPLVGTIVFLDPIVGIISGGASRVKA